MLTTSTATYARHAPGLDYSVPEEIKNLNTYTEKTATPPLGYFHSVSYSGRTNRLLDVDKTLKLLTINPNSKTFIFLIQNSIFKNADIDIYPPYLSSADIIKKIRMILGLPSKDIGDIFGVTRQTIYNYLRDKQDNSINPSNRARAVELNSICDDVANLLPYSPGALSKNYILDGESLFDLLTARELDKNRIVDFAKKLSRAMNEINKNIDGSDFHENTLLELTKYS